MLWYDIKDKIVEHPFIQNRIMIMLTILGILINFSIWLIIYFIFGPQVEGQRFLPLHYNIYFGIDNLGDFKQLYTLPILGFIIIIINLILSIFLHKRMKFLSYYLVISSGVMQLLLLWALFLIMRFNT